MRAATPITVDDPVFGMRTNKSPLVDGLSLDSFMYDLIGSKIHGKGFVVAFFQGGNTRAASVGALDDAFMAADEKMDFFSSWRSLRRKIRRI